MSKKITTLTDAQMARMPEWVDKWVAIGLSTEPANFEEAEKGVRGCYESAGLAQPTVVLRMSSPYGAVVGGAMAVLLLGGKNLRSQVDSQIWSQVEAQVQSQIGSQVESQVWAPVWTQVGSQIRSQVESQVRSQLGGAWSQYRGGNLWSSWYAYISFFRDVCGWSDETLQYFAHDERHALNASWCWYHDLVAAISDRPERILRDDQGRLHSESGMALQYRDGWGLWMWHGVAVDEQIIMRPETQTLEQINSEENAEVKRIRIERFGWERYLTAVGAAVIDRRRNDVEGTREALMRAGDMQALVCHCPSTGRVYALEVPMEVQTCEQAQGYLWSGSRLLADRQINIIGRT